MRIPLGTKAADKPGTRDKCCIAVFNKIVVEHILADRGRRIQHVLFLDVSDKEILGRIEKRRSQESRADDAPEAVARRLRAYREQTAPVLAWYEAHGGVHRILGSGTVEEIAGRIRQVLGR